MTAWDHLTTIFNQRRFLRRAGLLALCIAFITTLLFATVSHAATTTSKTINFQGRLLTNSGTTVSDGNYNIQFKIYQGGTGVDQQNPGGNLKWTESRLNTPTSSGVKVSNGYFTVSLGSVTPFGSSVDWDQDTLWLSMNVAGVNANCSTFDSALCKADGEMLPMKRITATPYAINAGHLGGRDASGFIQNGTSPQSANLSIQSATAENVAVSVIGASNQTANLLNVQADGVSAPVFAVGATGSVTIQNAVDSTSVLEVNSADGTNILSVNSLESSVKISQITVSSNTITSEGMTLDAGSGSLNLQGETVSIMSGGAVSIQAGTSTGNGLAGANVVISGGSGSSDSSDGLVVLSMPAVKTTADDTSCSPGGVLASVDCTLDSSTVDRSAAAIVGFDSDGKTITMPDPLNTMPGRLFYIVASSTSHDFTLTINSGKGEAIEQSLPMKKASTTGLFWSGFNWTVVGGSGGVMNLQNAYDASVQKTGDADITLNGTDGSGTLTIRSSATTPTVGSLIEVKNANDSNLFSVNSNATSGAAYITDGSIDDTTNFATNWQSVGGATVTHLATDGQNGSTSARVVAGTTAGSGITNKLALAPAADAQLSVSTYVKLASGPELTDFTVRYSPDHGTTFADCTNYSTQAVTSNWTHLTCDIATGGTSPTDPYLYFVQPTDTGSPRTFLIDTAHLTLSSNSSANVKIGSGEESSAPTLFTLDKSSTSPTSGDNADILGSMYYDTTLGKVQCYESDGWGACSDSPDTFVTLSPQYSNAVMNGTDIGVITSDLCSDMLNINDGSSAQATVCGEDETYNFYKWTSDQTSSQVRSIYVTYKLPGSFKQFSENSTSLMTRTDHADAEVSYQIYRDTKDGLTACSPVIPASTGNQSAWQKVAADGNNDPSKCDFAAGDSVLFRINLSSSKNANAYVSNLSFIINNH